SFIVCSCEQTFYSVLARVSTSYPKLTGRLPTCYSPSAARSTQQSPRRMIDELPALDLHVLGTPPAFVLSQDQTLHKIRKALSFKVSSHEVGKTGLPASNN